MNVHVHVHLGEDDRRILHRIDRNLSQLFNLEGALEMDLTALEAEVAQNTDVTASAVLLLDKLADEIRDNANNPTAIQAIADQLHANSTTLGEAVVRDDGQVADPDPNA